MTKVILAAVAASIAVSACSTGSKNVTASYVSSSKYNGWTCNSLSEELSRVQSHAAQISGKLEKDASKDAAVTTAGILLFWPALFFIEGEDPVKQTQLSTLLGEAKAIEAARIKACAR